MAKPCRDEAVTKQFVREFIYGVVTRSEQRLEKRMDELESKMEKKFDKVMEHLVNLAGQFKKFDEEVTVVSGKQRDHGDRIEKLEEAVFKSS